MADAVTAPVLLAGCSALWLALLIVSLLVTSPDPRPDFNISMVALGACACLSCS